MTELGTESNKQKLDADIAEKDQDIEKDASNEESKQQPVKVILPNGKYIIRCFVEDTFKLWYIWSQPQVMQQMGLPPSLIASRIRREAMGKEKIRERHLPDECFVEVINRGGDGIVLLRQVETGRYAAVDRELTFIRRAREVSEQDQMLSFYVTLNQIGLVGRDAEFELFAPTGNKADGLAIRSVGKERFVAVSGLNFLHPIVKDISQATLFKFELSDGEDRILDGEEDIDYGNEDDDDEGQADKDADDQSGGEEKEDGVADGKEK